MEHHDMNMLINADNTLNLPTSTSCRTCDLIILSFNQSGNSKASSDVSSRKAEGGLPPSGNQVSSSSLY